MLLIYSIYIYSNGFADSGTTMQAELNHQSHQRRKHGYGHCWELNVNIDPVPQEIVAVFQNPYYPYSYYLVG